MYKLRKPLAILLIIASLASCFSGCADNRKTTDSSSVSVMEDEKKDSPKGSQTAVSENYKDVNEYETAAKNFLTENGGIFTSCKVLNNVLVIDFDSKGDNEADVMNGTLLRYLGEEAIMMDNASDFCKALRVNAVKDGKGTPVAEQASCKDKLAPYISSCKEKSVADVEQGLEKLNTESFKYKDREDYVLNNSQVKLDTIDTYSLTLEFECTTEEAAKQADDFALGLHSAIAFNNTDFAYTTIVVKYKGEYINYTIMNNMNESMSGYNAPVCTSDVSAS